MKVSICRPSELGSSECDRWRELQGAHPRFANPMLTPEFAIAVSHAREDARVAVLQEAQRIVGFFAFQKGLAGIGSPIGAGISDNQAVVCEPGVEWDFPSLLASCGLGIWEFDHLIGEQVSPGLRSVLAPSPIIELGDGFDSYLAARLVESKKFFKTALYKERKLAKDHGEIRFTFGSTDEAELKQLIEWKSSQYRRTGRSDRFAKPWIRACVEELAAISSPTFAGVLSTLHVNDRLIAADLSLRSSSVLAAWFPAYDIAMAKYSPGGIRTLEMVRSAAATGLAYVDLGKGEEDYKRNLKTRDLWVAEGSAETKSVIALARRVQQAPRRYALEFVLSRPRLRSAARETLRGIGRLRGT